MFEFRKLFKIKR